MSLIIRSKTIMGVPCALLEHFIRAMAGFLLALSGTRYRIAATWHMPRVFQGALVGLALLSNSSYALEPAVQNGLNWLQGQVQANGSIASEAGSVATAFQVRTETAYALRDLASVPTSLVDAIQAEAENNNEYSSRRLLVSMGILPAADILNGLVSRQNADGGFGGTLQYESNSLDTAYALMAAKNLASKGFDVSQIVSRGLTYLAGSQGADGSWAGDSQGKVFVTSVALASVQEWYSVFSVGSVTGKARDWLLANRSSGAYPEILDTAAALIALSGQTNAVEVIGPLGDKLRTTQGVDGTWLADPYLTALALRALWTSSKPSQAVSTTGELTGRVVDAAGNVVIAEAALQLVENTNFSTASASDGKFTLSGVKPGIYTLRVSKLGYEARQLMVTVVAGETIAFSDIALKAQALTASLSGVIKTSTGTAIADAVIAVGTVSTFSSSTGAYSLTGLSPGAATLTVTKSGYQTATTTVTFAAGVSYVFSPALYTSNAPTTATLRGKLTDAVSAAAIAGGVVTLGGVNKTTLVDGSFEYTGLTAGPFSLTVSASGYQGISASGSVSIGINDMGKLPLQKSLNVSTLSGKVSDAQTGLSLAGAQLSIGGTAQTAISAADGTYTIANVTGTNLVINVSATGYQSGSFNLVLTQPGSVTADFPLLKLQPSGITFSAIKPSKDYYAPYDKLEVIVTIANSSTSPVDLIIEAQVLDAFNNVSFEMPANATGLGLNPPNLPITISEANAHDIELAHFMIQESGGQHTVLVRAHDAGGLVVAEGSVNFTVRDEAILGGGLVVTPPLAQAGSGIPVNFTAQLGNFGNQPVTSTTAELVVTLEHPDTNVSTQPETSVSQLSSNTLLNPSKALARDKAGNLYTAKSGYNDGRILRIDSAGNASVFATVPKTSGAPSLVDILVDAQDNVWAADTNGRLWKITQAAAITETKVVSLTSLTGFDISTTGDIFASGVGAGNRQMLVKRDAAGVETLLWSNGLSTPVGIVSDGAGGYVVSNSADGTLSKVSANGTISSFASGLNSPKGMVSDGAGNYFVVNSGNGSIAKVASDGVVSTLASGLLQPAGIAINAAGDLYVTTWGDSAVYRVSQNGTAELYVRGLARNPRAMKYDAAGNLFVAGDDGLLRQKNAAGQVSVVATGISSPRGMDITTSGDVLVASASAGSVVRVSGTNKTNFATGLSGPYGVAVSPAGEVWVTEQSQNRLTRLGSDGTLLERIESVLVNPNDLTVAPDGRIWISNSNSITLVNSGAASVWSRTRNYNKIAYDAASDGLVALSSYDVYRIDSTGTAVKIKTLAAYPYGIAAAPSGDIIVSNGATIQKLDGAGALTVLATFPSTVQSLSGDSTGRNFVVAGYKLYRTETNYSVTPLALPVNESAYWAKVGADGQVLVWTNYGRVYRINPDTGAFALVSGITSPTMAISDASGGIYVSTSSTHELSHYGATVSLLSRITGFSGPQAAVWYADGVRFTDSTNRMFHAVSGQTPVLIGGSLGAVSLAVSGADLFATNNTATFYKWNGSAWTTAKSIPNASNVTGIAARQDGAITVGDYAHSRVITVDGSSYATLEDFGGLTTPWGLAIAPDGKIYVADNGSSTISRLEGQGIPPTFIGKTTSPRYLAAEASGSILVSGSAVISRMNPVSGVVTALPATTGQPEQMLVDGSRIVSADSQGRLFKLENNLWSLLASGINSTRALGLQADRVYMLNGNGTLTFYQAGNLGFLADTGIAQPRSLVFTANGWLAGGDSGAMAMVDQAGKVTPINIASLISNKAVYGLHELSSGDSALLSGNSSGYLLSRLSINQPQQPPAAGTVVYSASIPVSSLSPGDGLTSFDFGDWTPPYGGGFRAEVKVPGVLGQAANYLYAGPHAQGLLSTTSVEQATGDQIVPVSLNVTGADFVTLSRVETGLIRPLTTISQPYGMVGDKSGNLWYTDSNNLYRKSTAGVNETIASGLALAYGLAVDSQEHFYLASRSASTGRYNLLQISTDGTMQNIADLGVTRVNGVAVNSRDEVFVGAPNNLIKVDPLSGLASTFTTVGLPNPRNLAMDGKDNIYVQNESDIISMIKPDRSSVLLYSKGDGIIDPTFEGDGYPNIAADCADNFYIAPWQWAVIKQSGEEHVLAQVVPRTSQVSALFDGLQISSHLSDIDYLSFDRFGSRILMWAHGYNEIWQVPVTCGAISVEAHLVAQPGQTLSGFNRPPSAVLPLVDGRTEYVFSLRDVSAKGVSIAGVTGLNELVLGENRPVMDSAYLQFQNSFSPQQVQLPVAVPSVHVRNLVDLAVSADKPEYVSGATALISGSMTNQNTRLVSGDLRVQIEDAFGSLVGPVIAQPAVMGSGESLAFSGPFEVGAIVPGKYVAVARVYENDKVVAVARVELKVLADQGQSTAYSKLSLDRLIYAPSDRLVISSRATNRSLNVLLENLRLVIRILDASGAVLQTKEYPILQLAPGLSQTFTSSYAYVNAASGTYHVEQTLRDADGRIFDQHVVDYTVQSSSDTGYGVTGLLTLAENEYDVGASVPLVFSVNNNGNAAVTGLPVTLSVISPETQQVLAVYPYTVNIAAGAVFGGAANWLATGLGGESYAVVLQAVMGGKTLTLAHDVIRIKPDPVKLGITNRFGSNSRVLVLAGCGKYVEHGKSRHDLETEKEHDDLEHHEGHDDNCVHDVEPDCSQLGAVAIDALLTERTISHFVTTDPAVFQRELRSGLYNSYWVSGKVDHLEDELSQEIREAAFRGESVLLEGLHDEVNETLDEVGGVKVRGKLRVRDQLVSLTTPFLPAVLPTLGRGLKLELTTGQVAGRFGTAVNSPLAVTTNLYGYGHGLLYGFDLIDSIPVTAAGWKDAFDQGLTWAAPVLLGTQVVGEAVQFQIAITNQGVDTNVGVRLTLPAGVVYLSSEITPVSMPTGADPQVVWEFNLVKDASRTVNVMVRLPETAGNISFVSEAGAIKGGVYKRFGEPVATSVNVMSVLGNLPAVTLAIGQLPVTLAKERAFRDQAIAKINEAISAAASAQYGEAIEELVSAVDKLVRIRTTSINEVRLQLDLAIKEAEWQWRKTH